MKYIIVVLVVVVGAIGLFAYFREGNEATVYNTPVSYATPQSPSDKNDMIRVTSPLPNASVRSPLTVTGEARGNWYFEASFPVKILDANGKVLAQHYAEAQGDWMTTEFVPFRSTITFASSTTPTGTLVLEKDNPSGLPEHADEIRIPISFSSSQEAMKTIKLYYYNAEKDKNAAGTVLCSAQGLVAFNRQVPVTNTPIQDAVRELLKGPTSTERSQTSGTEFPLAGVTLTGASLSSGVLTLTFADPQGKTSGGSCRVTILRAQIEATAKQFAGVNTVRLMPTSLFQP